MDEQGREMVLLLEAPMAEAKNLKSLFEEQELEAVLVRPEACGKKS